MGRDVLAQGPLQSAQHASGCDLEASGSAQRDAVGAELQRNRHVLGDQRYPVGGHPQHAVAHLGHPNRGELGETVEDDVATIEEVVGDGLVDAGGEDLLIQLGRLAQEFVHLVDPGAHLDPGVVGHRVDAGRRVADPVDQVVERPDHGFAGAAVGGVVGEILEGTPHAGQPVGDAHRGLDHQRLEPVEDVGAGIETAECGRSLPDLQVEELAANPADPVDGHATADLSHGKQMGRAGDQIDSLAGPARVPGVRHVVGCDRQTGLGGAQPAERGVEGHEVAHHRGLSSRMGLWSRAGLRPLRS